MVSSSQTAEFAKRTSEQNWEYLHFVLISSSPMENNKVDSNLKAPPPPLPVSVTWTKRIPHRAPITSGYLAHDLFTHLRLCSHGNEAPGQQTRPSLLIATAPVPKIVLGIQLAFSKYPLNE